MLEVNGIAHIALTVSDVKHSKPFYRKLFAGLGMKIVLDDDNSLYGVGGRTGVVIHQSLMKDAINSFNQQRVGLHHFCFRMRSKEDVDQIYETVSNIGAKIIHEPQEDGFAPGYYSVLFEDPDGIRLEANFIPGKGILAPGLDQIGDKDTLWHTDYQKT
ncbi:MAG: bleomycin resistance protein [Gammaproteobacteria bacterium]|nr:bleomycin resistance protein [Gammaproteobacteria bacterium]|tara:strand:+ start:382 stop:858 length:477 start_codon:yes stop_codon:yes gene_type:complete